MRACVQRVRRARVTVGGTPTGEIEQGMLVLLGVARGDTDEDARYLADKLVHLRIFDDDAGRMNRSLLDCRGQMLAVSQFTLLGDCRKGRRPSFVEAAEPDQARSLYETFMAAVELHGVDLQSGQFQQHMLVELTNDGPVTLLVESRSNKSP